MLEFPHENQMYFIASRNALMRCLFRRSILLHLEKVFTAFSYGQPGAFYILGAAIVPNSLDFHRSKIILPLICPSKSKCEIALFINGLQPIAEQVLCRKV